MKYKAVPTQYADLPDIDEVTPLNENDQALFEELQAVLTKHGAVNRFGISLLHNHFAVNEGEMLVEHCDPVNRTLTIRPERVKGDQKTIQTNWRFMGPVSELSQAEAGAVMAGKWKAQLACTQACVPHLNGFHGAEHAPDAKL